MVDSFIDRYSRQVLFAGIGKEGQERIRRSQAVLVGCGALGSLIADLLVRAGIGRLRIIDRDFVETSNLQRQTLFDESDARQSLPKAAAAERHLRAANSEVAVEGLVADLTPRTAPELFAGFDLILDGTDNFESRLLINDFAVKASVPWIYCAVVGAQGVVLPIFPGKSACLACLLESPGETDPARPTTPQNDETCDTVGVIAPAAAAIASLAAAQAIKHMAGKSDAVESRLVSLDVWNARQTAVRVDRNPHCRCCSQRRFTYLEGKAVPHVTMCGRNSVQIHERTRNLDLPALGQRLGQVATDVRQNSFLLRFHIYPYDVTVFADGRAIIKGTQDPAVARSLYARYLGA